MAIDLKTTGPEFDSDTNAFAAKGFVVDEKTSPCSNASNAAISLDSWDKKVERRLKFKADLILLPMLVLTYLLK
jgi:hypothetical protein